MDKGNEAHLEKQLSPVNVWALALGCIIGWGAFVMPGNTFLGKAGPLGTAIAMGIATLIMIIIAFNYNFMIRKYPVAGGEFTYTYNAFGENHAFICSWFLGLSYLCIVPLNGTALALIGRNLMNNIFQVGFHYTVAGYDIYLGEIILALVALVGIGFLSIRGVKFAGVFQTLLVFALVGGVLIVAVAALISDKASFSNLSPAFYENSTTGSAGALGGVLAVVAVAPWAFVGFDTIPQAAEEFKFSPSKTKVIMVISILFGGTVYIVLNTVTAMVLPEGYGSWIEYIDDLPNLDGLISLPTFYAAKTLLGSAGLVFLGVSVLAAILSGIVGFYMATSRLLYSMSRENVLPAWFGQLHPEYSTPRNAILFVMVIAIIAPFFGRTALGWIVDMSSLGAAIGYGYTSLAAVKYARRKNNTVITITGVTGTLMAIMFCVLLLVPIPLFGCSLGKESMVCLIIWIIMGVIFYAATAKKRQEAARKKAEEAARKAEEKKEAERKAAEEKAARKERKAAEAKAARKERKRRKKEAEACIEAAMNEKGWSREEAIEQIEDAMSRLGLTYNEYRRYKMARIDPKDQERELEDLFRRKEENKEERAEHFADIMSRNGWTMEQANEEIRKITKRTGASRGEIWSYKMEQMTEDEQDEIYLRVHQSALRKSFPIDKKTRKIFDCKDLANVFFADYIGRPWCINNEVDYEEFCRLFKDSKGVVYKPAFGLQARGIEAYPFDKYDKKEVFDIIRTYSKGVVEEQVQQHPKMASLNPTSVNCLRVVTISSADKPVDAEGNLAAIMSVTVKSGGSDAIVDNLHAGRGVLIGIDLDTGLSETDGSDWFGNMYKKHPVSGTVLRGFEVPFFNESKEFVLEMIRSLKLEGVIGWDIAITEKGPIVIEANARPDPRLMGLPYALEKTGLKKRLDKYIEFSKKQENSNSIS